MMSAELSLERMAQNATAARRVGDDRTADYWTERVELENARRELAAIPVSDLWNEWDELKGSPEHG